MTNQISFALCYICNIDCVILQSESGCCQGPNQQLLFFYETLLKKIVRVSDVQLRFTLVTNGYYMRHLMM
jgi:hypothetical protein